MELLTTINGNGQKVTQVLPEICILTNSINEIAIEYIKGNTGLSFKKGFGYYKAQPTESGQIVKLFLTYNFKTRYYDNADHHNVLMLKLDHHVGFDVDSICFECVKANHIHVGNLKQGDRLVC